MKTTSVLLTGAVLALAAASAWAGDTSAADHKSSAQPAQPNPLFNDKRPGGQLPEGKAPAGPGAPSVNAAASAQGSAQSDPLLAAPPKPRQDKARAPSAPSMDTALPAPPDQASHTKTIANVEVPDDVNVAGTSLLLNGAGVYKRWWVMKQYVAALYLDDTATSTAQVVVTPGPKRVALHILRPESDHDLASGLTMALRDNSTAADVKKLDRQITHFQHLLSDVKKGDEVDFDYLPAKGVRVSIDGKVRGMVKGGAAFERALLRVWLGDEPVDTDLKHKLLAASAAPDV